LTILQKQSDGGIAFEADSDFIGPAGFACCALARSSARAAGEPIGGISADGILNMRNDEQILLIESKIFRCRQKRYYESKELFGAAGA
jgi:hypothetical protein